MRRGGTGGYNTGTGLIFEDRVALEKVFSGLPGYGVERTDTGCYSIEYKGRQVARLFKQHGFYRYLKEHGIDWKNIISSQLLPDSALLVIVRETLFIIEMKFQGVPGSVDQK